MVRGHTKISDDINRQLEQPIPDESREQGQTIFELGTTDIEAIGTGPDPEGDTGAGEVGNDAPRKRKPRSDAGVKRGTRTSTKGAKANISLEALERLLYSSHMILSTVLKTQELALAEEEAKQLAAAMGAVARHYETEVAAKTLDWINLVQCGAFVYGSRVVAWKARKTMEKAEKKAAANGNATVKDKATAMPSTLYDVVMQ